MHYTVLAYPVQQIIFYSVYWTWKKIERKYYLMKNMINWIYSYMKYGLQSFKKIKTSTLLL